MAEADAGPGGRQGDAAAADDPIGRPPRLRRSAVRVCGEVRYGGGGRPYLRGAANSGTTFSSAYATERTESVANAEPSVSSSNTTE